MQVIIITSLGVFFSSSILLLVLYLKMKNKWSETDQKRQESSNKCDKLNKTIAQIKDDLSTKRIGYYTDSRLLIETDRKDGKPGDTYKYTIFIKEIDRYTNGMSKIQLSSIEITSGFNPAHNIIG